VVRLHTRSYDNDYFLKWLVPYKFNAGGRTPRFTAFSDCLLNLSGDILFLQFCLVMTSTLST
jgi:hypothetical protein